MPPAPCLACLACLCAEWEVRRKKRDMADILEVRRCGRLAGSRVRAAFCLLVCRVCRACVVAACELVRCSADTEVCITSQWSPLCAVTRTIALAAPCPCTHAVPLLFMPHTPPDARSFATVQAARRRGKDVAAVQKNLEALEGLLPDLVNLNKMKPADWVRACACACSCITCFAVSCLHLC